MDAVPALVEELCDYVNDQFKSTAALHLASYVMWRINWVHPFDDGNGRTARAASYLVLCVKLDSRLPGKPTIPNLIVDQKKPYYAALEAADVAWAKNGRVDLSAMEELMGNLLGAQLVSAMSKREESRSAWIAGLEDNSSVEPSRLPCSTTGETVYRDPQSPMIWQRRNPMRRAVIVSTARTPIGRAYRGAFNDTQAQALAGHAIAEAVKRAGVDPAEIDDVIIGAALQQGAQGFNVARQSALRAGLPDTRRGDVARPAVLVGHDGDRHRRQGDHA